MRRSVKEIGREKLEYLMRFYSKDVHCIKYKKVDIESTSKTIEFNMGEFYKIWRIIFSNGTNFYNDLKYLYNSSDPEHQSKTRFCSIVCNNVYFTYDEFFEYFELKTIKDIKIEQRKNKIKSILK